MSEVSYLPNSDSHRLTFNKNKKSTNREQIY